MVWLTVKIWTITTSITFRNDLTFINVDILASSGFSWKLNVRLHRKVWQKSCHLFLVLTYIYFFTGCTLIISFRSCSSSSDTSIKRGNTFADIHVHWQWRYRSVLRWEGIKEFQHHFLHVLSMYFNDKEVGILYPCIFLRYIIYI